MQTTQFPRRGSAVVFLLQGFRAGVHCDWEPAAGGLAHFFVLDAEEPRDAGAGQVDVEHADVVAAQGEGEGELYGYAGFADAAFAGEDKEFMFYSGEARGYDGDVWVGPFRGGGADGLVGAAGAGVTFAREVGFWTGAVFCWGVVVLTVLMVEG